MRFLYSVAPDARPAPRTPTETRMTIDILLTRPLPESIDAEPSARYAVHRLYATDEPDALVARIAPRIPGVVIGGVDGLSAALMDRLGALEIVEINGIGTDAVDLERARARRS